MTTFIDAAMEHAKRGLSVIPIRHRSAQGKEPAIRAVKPYMAVAASPAQLTKWFTRTDLDGLAVITGDASDGLTIRDFDDADAYRRWAEEWPAESATLPTARTARGFHVWFRSSCRKTSTVGDGELRAGGVYVLAPPSRHPTGATYRWIIPLPPVGEPLPFIEPEACGLDRCWCEDPEMPASQVSQQSEQRDRDDREPFMASVCSVASVDSVRSVVSVHPAGELDSAALSAIASTLPKREGARNHCLFDFARTVKALPQYVDADPDALRPLVREWHRRALAVIGTKPFDDTWADFLRAWKRVRFPKGSEPMAAIANRASNTKPPAWVLERFDDPTTHRLIVLCRELNRAADGGVWYLACRTAGELLGIEHTTAWSRLRLLEDENVIQATERGRVGGKRATRYRYIAEDGGA